MKPPDHSAPAFNSTAISASWEMSPALAKSASPSPNLNNAAFIVILNKRSLRSEEPVPSLPRESGRAVRSVALFATQESRVRLASLLNCTTSHYPALTLDGPAL